MSASPEVCLPAPKVISLAEQRTDDPTVRKVNPAECDEWDALLATRADGSFFHSAAWARVLHDTYGYDPVFFTVTEGNRLVALLPVMEVNSWLTGRRGVSLPFTDACEPLGESSALTERIVPAVMQHGRERGWRYLECRGGKQVFKAATASQCFFSHELSLFKDEEHLFARCESATRRAIRKAQKLGVTVEVSQSLEAVRLFYSLHCQTRKKHGVPPQPFDFFCNIHKHILSRNLGIVVLARHHQELVAAAVYFHFGAQAIYKYGASDESFQELRGNNLVMWEAIKWYARRGTKVLHLGRTSIANEGLRRFKLGWGSQECGLEYVRYDLRKSRFVTGKDESVGWYNRAFNLLPVGVLRTIGAVLYRHIA